MNADRVSARRPLPRQLDVSDWEIDADVRSGVRSSMEYTRGRSPWATRGAASETRAHRSEKAVVPVNRYDTVDTVQRPRTQLDRASPVQRSRPWSEQRRNHEALLGMTGSRERGGDLLTSAELDAQLRMSSRPQPRASSMTGHVVANIASSEPRGHRPQDNSCGSPVDTYGSDHVGIAQWGSTLRGNAVGPSDARDGIVLQRQDTGLSPESPNGGSLNVADELALRSYHSNPFETPIRRSVTQNQSASFTGSTVVSSALSPSVSDAPSTLASSPATTSPSNPQATTSNQSRYDSLNGTSRDAPASLFNTPSPRTTPASDQKHQEDVPEDKQSPTLHRRSHAVTDSPQRNDRVPARARSAKQAREQLYAFRGEMRRVFARVDEMVDLHRDLFKSDPMSGIPTQNRILADEAARFAVTTFEQLAALRAQFEAVVFTAEEPESPLGQESQSGAHTRRVLTPALTPCSISPDRANGIDIEESDSEDPVSSSASSPDTRATIHPSVSSARPVSSLSPSVSDSSPSVSPHPVGLHRWPALPSPSSSSKSSVSKNVVASEFLTPPRSHTSDPNQGNVFQDFDQRMEEIRASLNALARGKTRRRVISNNDSNEAGTAVKSSLNTVSSSADRGPGDENSAMEANQSRRNREARLRQLLRELGDTGS